MHLLYELLYAFAPSLHLQVSFSDSPKYQGDNEEYEEDVEKDLRNGCCTCSNTTKTEYSCNDRYYQENNCPA